MRNRILILITLAMATMLSCKDEKKNEVVKEVNQMQKVMTIHDEVMPQMSEVSRLAGQLKSKIDTTAKGIEYQKAMRDLQAANEAMMEWMQGFTNQFENDEINNGKELSADKKLVLNAEEAKIKAIKEQYESSIANAEALLKE